MLLASSTQTEPTSAPIAAAPAATYRPKDCKPNHSVLTFNGLHFLPLSSRTDDAPVPPEGIRGYYKHAARGTHFYTREGVIEAYAPTNMHQGYFVVSAYLRPEGIRYMFSSTLVTERFMGIEDMSMSKQSDALRSMSFTPLNRLHHLLGVKPPEVASDAHQTGAVNTVAAYMCHRFPGGVECISQVQVCPLTGIFDASQAFKDMLDFSEGDSVLPESQFLVIGIHQLPVVRINEGRMPDSDSMLLKVTDPAALQNATAALPLDEQPRTSSDRVPVVPEVPDRKSSGMRMR